MTRRRDIIRIADEPDSVTFQEAWHALALHLWRSRGVDINGDHPLAIGIRPCPIEGTNMRGAAIVAVPRGITDPAEFSRNAVVAYFGEVPLGRQGCGIVADGRFGMESSSPRNRGCTGSGRR